MLSIKPLKSKKDKIKQPHLAAAGHIPKINTSTIFSGRSGSGKSVCMVNLLTRPEMLGDAFDEVYLISPTGSSDDIQKQLKLSNDNIFIDVMEGIKHMVDVLEVNRIMIESIGADRAPKIALLYDDVIGDRQLLKHPMFIKSFIACRHYNLTTFICTQSFTAVPRCCRLQANNIIIFACSDDESKLLSESHTPSKYKRKEFVEMLEMATEDPYSFLYINLTQPQRTRYRKNFETILTLTRHK
tara:strand:+ start:914 stop:1639 length:726 start_codon:yes stop_codon:yes gene_type:complete